MGCRSARGWSLAAVVAIIAIVAATVGVSVASAAAPVVAQVTVRAADTGDPIGDVWVHYFYFSPAEGDFVYGDLGLAASDGTFQVRDTHDQGPGQWRIGAGNEAGYRWGSVEFAWDGIAPVVIDLELEPATLVASGMLTDALSGSPVTRGACEAMWMDSLYLIRTYGGVEDDGSYEIYDYYESLESGSYRIKYLGMGRDGHYYLPQTHPTDLAWDGVTPLTADLELWPAMSVAGGNRFETAVETSKEGYPDGLDPEGPRTVIIASGHNWPDALSATSLAGVLDAPILLARLDSLPEVTLAEIRRLGAESAIIVGGESALGEAVAAALRAELGNDDVERIAGANRYRTGEAVAARVIAELGPAYDGTAMIATGRRFADSLAAAPLASAGVWPIFLVPPDSDVPVETRAAMTEVTEALVLGGELAVSAQAYGTLETMVGEANVERLAGTNRYKTGAAIARYAAEEAGHTWEHVAFATGEVFPDALGGGALQGKRHSMVLLVSRWGVDADVAAILSANRAGIGPVTIFGGPYAIWDDALLKIGDALR